ncbi:hypothetical protein GVN21_09395 [Caulobacter sp. SLTY]|uniref:hypothetical protein n=1 Tax=Caulobacter sp. SLTY TaxID=2683262 RepID=UPI001411D692|nr:hypothetical protein [Caulobacter sp. SLTY]NBB15568.1 hypothetical protein [Caulobacter sp. SLTY]
MTAFLLLLVLGVLVALSTAAVRRDRRTKAAEAFAADLRERRRLEAMYVSKLDRSFVAFRFSDHTLVLGDGSEEREYPFAAIIGAAVEVTRTPAKSGRHEDGWIKQLAVRVRVNDPDRLSWAYSILAWPRGKGLPADAPTALAMMDQAQRIVAQVEDAKRVGLAP